MGKRGSGEKSASVGFRLSKEDFAKLEQIALREQASPGTVSRRMVVERLDGDSRAELLHQATETKAAVDRLVEKLAGVALLLLTIDQPLDDEVARRWVYANILDAKE